MNTSITDAFAMRTASRSMTRSISLFALNEIDTYRYSVSSAGAGWHGPDDSLGLQPRAHTLSRRWSDSDFVTGIRNHGNALQAMLLYMHDTWNDLTANDEVKYARAKIGPPSELLAADTTRTLPSCRAI